MVGSDTASRLRGRVALVTGGASGIGRATVLRLAAEGASVLVTDIQDGAGEETVGEAAASGGRAVFAHHDVSDPVGWKAVVGLAVDELGGLDILVNNAGIADQGAIEEVGEAEYDRTIAVTQTSVFLGMKASASALKESDYASVINISSIFGASGGFGSSPAYHCAKGAVRILTKNAALHWAADSIRVNSVHPGFIDTPILAAAKETDAVHAMLAWTPMGRLGQAREIAAAVAFLASDDASFVTGSELYVDGGYLAR